MNKAVEEFEEEIEELEQEAQEEEEEHHEEFEKLEDNKDDEEMNPEPKKLMKEKNGADQQILSFVPVFIMIFILKFLS